MLRRISVSLAVAYLAVQTFVGLWSAMAPGSVARADSPPPVSRPATGPASQPGPPTGPGSAPQGPGMMMPAPTDSFAHERDSLMNVVLTHIAGHENAPAESVFKNIRTMKGVSAGRLVRIMNFGFGRSLGVGCRHCHVPGGWDKEDKPQKQIAREMMAMTETINNELLPKIQNLKSEKPTVNCTTCHRGSVKPALNL